MNILYFGTACDKDYEDRITKITKATYTIAQNNLERALLNGLYDNGVENLELNCLPALQYEVLSKRTFIHSEVRRINHNLSTKTFPILKIKFIKELLIVLTTFFRIIKWNFKFRKDEERTVFSVINYAPVTLIVYVLSKIFKYKNVSMLCDLSKDTYATERGKKESLLKNNIMKLYLRLIQKLETSFDKYILLTSPMNDLVNKQNKPFVIIEGIYNNDLSISKNTSDKSKNILIYSGSLFSDYGIDIILESFKLIKNPSFELHIYGSGELETLVRNYQSTDKRIKYFGFVSREELFDRLNSATLLLNLRDPSLSYTKYSFPSKTFEYLASGTPILTTKLKGIPNEYYDFMYTVDAYNSEIISNKILEICEIDLEERIKFAEKARKFVIENKTQNPQVKKIISLLEK